MIFRLLADLTVVVHLAFVFFILFGGVLVIRRPAIAWVHLPVVAWGALLEFGGWICPLTPLENYLRARGGEAVYEGSFVERYVMPLLYPQALTRELQFVLGGVVLALNAAIYAVAFTRRRRRRPGGGPGAGVSA